MKLFGAILLTAALALNLALPMEWVSLSVCCRQSAGGAGSKQPACCQIDGTAPETISGQNCCAPQETQLRESPASEQLTSANVLLSAPSRAESNPALAPQTMALSCARDCLARPVTRTDAWRPPTERFHLLTTRLNV